MKLPMYKGNDEFKPIPDGRHRLKITRVKVDEQALKLNIRYETENGESDFEFYTFTTAEKGVMNEKALRAFSWTARCCLGEYEADDIDPKTIEGHFLEADVSHSEYTNGDGDNKISARFSNKKPCEPFETVKKPTPDTKKDEAKADDDDELDIDDLLDF